MTMYRYNELSPTKFDHKVHRLNDKQHWFVAPVIQMRDSGCLDESNWFSLLERLGGLEDFSEESFGHWACGWFNIILVKPNTPAFNVANDAEKELEDYPILDEMDFCEREWEEVSYAWENLNVGERITILAKHGASIFSARREDVPDGLAHYEDFYTSS